MPAVVRPKFRPDPEMDRKAMEQLQREIAATASFTGSIDSPTTVVGIDQAFVDDKAVSVATAMANGEVIEQVHAVESLELPYIPGLLAFREGPPIIAALEKLTVDPDCLLLDGSGRIHYREAGIATHIGVVFDLPAIGVAKRLLCGEPVDSTTKLSTGARVPIVADTEVTAPDDTTIGYAVQTRQFDSPDRHINPIYVSPGHRIDAETAATIARQTCAGYKLPEPIRTADQAVGELT